MATCVELSEPLFILDSTIRAREEESPDDPNGNSIEKILFEPRSGNRIKRSSSSLEFSEAELGSRVISNVLLVVSTLTTVLEPSSYIIFGNGKVDAGG